MSQLPSLLNRGTLAIPAGASAARAQELRNAVPKNYIVNMIRDTPVTGIGSRVFVIKSGTGSGKSTVLPTALAQRGRRVAVTEPQRLTAEEIPYDICSYDREFKMGENIGFQTGLINKAPRHGIVFMTTGVLLMHLMLWPAEKFIRRYSTIMIDEVHRHDLQTDVLLRLVKQFLNKFWNNPECPVIVLMSATMDERKYMDYFETKNFVEVVGVTFPIETHWPKTAIGDVKQAVVKLCSTLTGDTIVFLPTVKIIKQISKALQEHTTAKSTVIEIMSKTISRGDVKQMLKPAGRGVERRIALATNAAETGLTLPFLKNVVDTGLVLQVAFNPQYNCLCVSQQVVSAASATQRRGRVGRKFPGEWYPLYRENAFKAMIPANPAEIYVQDVSKYVLTLIVSLSESTMSAGHVETLREFDPATVDLIHPASGETLILCYEKLYQLGMITTDWRPTVVGYLASKLRKTGLESAKSIFSAVYYGVDVYKMVIIASAVNVGDLGDLSGFTKQETFDDTVQCGFTKLLIAYELLGRQIKRMTAKHLSTAWIREWCENMSMNYESWLSVIENVYELTFGLMELGIRVDMTGVPLIDTLESDPKTAVTEIRLIKNCLYEGYRLNTASWNDFMQSYVAHFKHSKIEMQVPGNPINIMTNQIVYRSMAGRMVFTAGDYVSVLDEHVVLDNHFMY